MGAAIARAGGFDLLSVVIIKAGSKGRESGPKVGSKFGQSNNNTKLAPIGMKFGP